MVQSLIGWLGIRKFFQIGGGKNRAPAPDRSDLAVAAQAARRSRGLWHAPAEGRQCRPAQETPSNLSLTKDDRPTDPTRLQCCLQERLFTDFTPADEFPEAHLRFLVLARTLYRKELEWAFMSSRDTVLMLDHTHCRAICDEIGERLRDMLKPQEIPPRLRVLIARLDELERAASPSIVPSTDEMDIVSRPARNLLEPQLS